MPCSSAATSFIYLILVLGSKKAGWFSMFSFGLSGNNSLYLFLKPSLLGTISWGLSYPSSLISSSNLFLFSLATLFVISI